jgi:hypothetical protein
MFNKYNQNDSNINGIYTYIKYGNGLNINGSLKNNKLNLEEKNTKQETSGYIEANYSNVIIVGYWYNKDTKRKLKFFVNRL